MTSLLAISMMLGSDPFASPLPTRLALTPDLDGAIAQEEWDLFNVSRNSATYLQWEPGLLHFAAVLEDGEDLIVSLDLAGDGWLIGEDNVELRFSRTTTGATTTVRKLDASLRAGPAWVPANDRGITLATSEENGMWTIEASVAFDAKRVAREGQILGIDMKTAPVGAYLGPAFLPRSLQFVTLGFDRTEWLPDGMTWRSTTKLREVAREDDLKIRFEMNGAGAFSQVQMRCEGLVQNDLSSIARPFSGFDKKGRASVEYKSSIALDAETGWRVVRATLVGIDGREVVMRTSFKLSDLIEFDVSLPETVKFSRDQQVLKGNVYVRSTGLGKVEGKYVLSAPATWTVERGGDENFAIYHPRGRDQIGLKFIIPAGAVGEYPITFTALIGQRKIERTVIVRIDPPVDVETPLVRVRRLGH